MDTSQWHVDRHYLPAADGSCVYAIHLGKSQSYMASTTWQVLDIDGQEVPATCEIEQYQRKPLLFLTERPAATIVFTGPQPQRTVGYTLRDPELASAALPLSPTAEQYADMSDDTDDVVNKHRYAPVREDDPDRQPDRSEFDLTQLDPIAVSWEEPPALPDDLRWEPSPAYVALWGPALAPHLVPGTLTGVRNKVLDQVLAHPWIRPWSTHAYQGHVLADRDGKVTFYYDRRFEGELTKVVKVGRPGRVKQKTRTVLRTDTQWYKDIKAPPDGIAGENLAHALRQLPDIVAAEVERILPVEGHVCAHCEGAGFVITEGGDKA